MATTKTPVTEIAAAVLAGESPRIYVELVLGHYVASTRKAGRQVATVVAVAAEQVHQSGARHSRQYTLTLDVEGQTASATSGATQKYELAQA